MSPTTQFPIANIHRLSVGYITNVHVHLCIVRYSLGLVPLFQNETMCKTFHVDMSFNLNDFAPELVLKTRQRTIQNWPKTKVISLRSSRFRFLQAKRGKRARALGKKEQKSRSGGPNGPNGPNGFAPLGPTLSRQMSHENQSFLTSGKSQRKQNRGGQLVYLFTPRCSILEDFLELYVSRTKRR